jgi:hypothetical protein
VHIIQVAIAGWNNFRAMITGFEVMPGKAISEQAADENNVTAETII